MRVKQQQNDNDNDHGQRNHVQFHGARLNSRVMNED